MGLYDRLVGTDPNIRASCHQITAAISEFRRGQITGDQSRDAFTPPLDATEQSEGQAIVDALNAGTITFTELEQVLAMAESRMPPYDNEAAVKTRLGF